MRNISLADAESIPFRAPDDIEAARKSYRDSLTGPARERLDAEYARMGVRHGKQAKS